MVINYYMSTVNKIKILIKYFVFFANENILAAVAISTQNIKHICTMKVIYFYSIQIINVFNKQPKAL